jgi:hypothetical protein
VVLLVVLLTQPTAWGDESPLLVQPPAVTLTGHDAEVGVLVDLRRSQEGSGGQQLRDVTSAAQYSSSNTDIFTVDARGGLHSVADGSGELTVQYNNLVTRVPVEVCHSQIRGEYHFERDIIPLLSKYRCNSSGCHGKAEGQNGFKLSVFGFDPTADLESLTRQGRGRRTSAAAPETSLLLTKSSGILPHGGGVRIARDTRAYSRLLGWIQAGTPEGEESAPQIARIEIKPQNRPLEMRWRQQLRVTAFYTDGSQEDVTATATYQVNNEGLADVDGQGLVTVGDHPGQVAVMSSYMGQVATFQALIPQGRDRLQDMAVSYPATNAIDHAVNQQLRKLRIAPSVRAGDAEFARRTYLDIIGTLPTSDEVVRFLAEKSPDKRQMLVNQLLERPEYADVWALRWGDVLRVDRQKLGHKNALSYYRWIREQFAENRPFDEVARDLVTASGPLANQPAGHFYQVVAKPGERASTLSQVFLGVRIACAECHHHPFDRWSQTDFYGMAGFFQPVSSRSTSRGAALAISKPRPLSHPRTKKPVIPHALGEAIPSELAAGDPRMELADWITADDNPFFARAIVNRVWARLLGRGIVEPVDDFRETNPPSNPQLLDALATHFIQSDYDLHELIRYIVASEAYQRSPEPNPSNLNDEWNYSRGLLKRMEAEVLYDAINQVTGSADKFRGVPNGARAIQLWDSEVQHEFLTLFGRPQRKTSCECERAGQPSVSQVLHVLNSPNLEDKLSHPQGRVLQLARRYPNDLALANALYLTFFARPPTADELRVASQYLSNASDRPAAAIDLSWAMLNSLEFLFNH